MDGGGFSKIQDRTTSWVCGVTSPKHRGSLMHGSASEPQLHSTQPYGVVWESDSVHQREHKMDRGEDACFSWDVRALRTLPLRRALRKNLQQAIVWLCSALTIDIAEMNLQKHRRGPLTARHECLRKTTQKHLMRERA